jgi:type 1 glutamine amidotransferase
MIGRDPAIVYAAIHTRRSWLVWLLVMLTGRPVMAAEGSVVLMIAEDEYRTATTLPAFATGELVPLGLRCTTVMAEPEGSHHFPGLVAALPAAELLVISVRRRAPAEAQMALIRQHIAAGKAVVGIRTASHAFAPKVVAPGHAAWPQFDREVLGGSYDGHFGNEAATLALAASAAGHPVLAGVDVATLTTTRLYKNATLAPGAVPLVLGESTADKRPQHVAWVHRVGQGRVFSTSLGAPADFAQPAFRRLLRNGVCWALGRTMPEGPAGEGAAR